MNRIACIVDTISRNAGGLNASVRGLMSAMQEQGNVVSIFSVVDEHEREAREQWASFTLQTYKAIGPRKFGYAPELEHALGDFRPDIIHTHGMWTYTSVLSRNASNRLRVPNIIHPHGMMDPWALRNSYLRKRFALALYEKKHLTEASCIRALCDSELEAIRAFGLKNPVCVVPNGIDLPILNPMEGNKPRPGKKVLLYLGRLHAKKGLKTLVRAWSEMNSSHLASEWTLAIAGWDQLGHESELKTLATKLGLRWSDIRENSDNNQSLQEFLTNPASLVFLGPQFDSSKELLFRTCEAFVLPSLSEGLPMVVLEAWAFSKPVIMTQMCNLPEGFSERAAIKIEPTVSSVREGLENLFNLSDESRSTIGCRGRALVEAQFNWQGIAGKMRKVNNWLTRGEEQPPCVVL
ncbi:MAG: glycosyltransferase [Prosthecobacter sp.]